MCIGMHSRCSHSVGDRILAILDVFLLSKDRSVECSRSYSLCAKITCYNCYKTLNLCGKYSCKVIVNNRNKILLTDNLI